MSQKKRTQFSTEEEFRKFGKEFGATLKPGDCVLLEGELGAGKTTLASAMIEGLAPGTEFQGSPTFPIINQYMLHGEQELYHVDVYRLENEKELQGTGVEDLFYNSSHILIVEWLSKFPPTQKHWLLQKHRHVVRFKISASPNGRTMSSCD